MHTVIVIDDETYVRRGIINNTDWAGIGCEVVGEASDGEEGYNLILKKKPDLVICDVRMPVMDGLSMVENLRKKGENVKVIFLTAYDDFSYIQKALRLGAVDYILKPFEDGQLETTIRRILNQDNERSRLENEKQQELRDDQLLPIRKEDPSMNRYSRSAIQYIRDHYQESNVSISSVASTLGVSEGHLSRLFKKDTGMSVSTYVTTYRIREAMRLLRDIHYRVSEAAAKVGYQDVGYFSTTFRKMTGMTPSEFQEKG